MLADGGVKAVWACGATKVDRDEVAVDLVVLEHQEWAADHVHRPHVLPHLPHLRRV